jgi:hypothetical protein
MRTQASPDLCARFNLASEQLRAFFAKTSGYLHRSVGERPGLIELRFTIDWGEENYKGILFSAFIYF